MIVLDTNVLSELTRPVPAPAALQPARGRDQASIYADLIATRKLGHFARSGVPPIDPWQAPTTSGGGVVQ